MESTHITHDHTYNITPESDQFSILLIMIQMTNDVTAATAGLSTGHQFKCYLNIFFILRVCVTM